MVAIFEDVNITWDGNKYTIKGDDKILMLLASIEEVITAQELFTYAQKGNMPLVKLSMAYTKVLNFVGVDITAPQVYQSVFNNITDQEQTTGVIMALVQMMIPISDKKEPQKGKRKPRKTGKTQGAK